MQSNGITVAICTWNRADVLERTLDQMTHLRPPIGRPWEVLVVDNNSSDATRAVAEGFAARLPIRVVLEERPGIAFARNRSIAESPGDLIVWTDDDVLVEVDWLCNLVEGIDSRGADFGFGRALPCWDGEAPDWFEWTNHAGKFALLDYGTQPFLAESAGKPFYTLNAGARLEAVRALGGFRNELSERAGRLHCGEDVDLYLRALEKGMKIVYLPDALVRHIIPSDRKTKTFHRKSLRAAYAGNYEALPAQFPSVQWLAGMPRFLYGAALKDSIGLGVGLLKRDSAKSFFHELQLRRFLGMWREAMRHSFRRESAGAPPTPNGAS